MAIFAKGIPRLVVLLAAVAAFCLVPPETLARGPNLCLWRHLLHLPACPACGTTRALAAFFHGRLAQALTFNGNVVLTGPGLLILIVKDLFEFLRRARGRHARSSRLEFRSSIR